jgi:hypothetical protein
MAAAVRLYFKKQIRVDHLTIPQFAMLRIGTVGVAQVADRTARALNENDQPAKPLKKGYAIFKSKRGKGNRRNLRLTGDMWREFRVRTVGENRANATLTSRKGRLKGLANQRIERWVAFSPANRAKIMSAANAIVTELKPRLLLSKFFNR